VDGGGSWNPANIRSHNRGKPGAERASSRHDTQRQADQRAAEILRNSGGGERVTHGVDGRIRSKDTIAPGNDPNPPKDKEH
jgi:hypothetical protein